MELDLAIASKRDARQYDPRPLPEGVLTRILDAGRLSGSARNDQQWQFVVATDASDRARLGRAAYSPGNLVGAPVVVAIVIRGREMQAFDAGRAAQNMMLAAWGEGVVSCPNGIAEPAVAADVLGLDEGWRTAIMLSLGYPAQPRDPTRRDPEEWSRRARRRPLAESVRYL